MHGREVLEGFFAGRIPDDWFVEAPDIDHDRDEILVVGRLPEPELPHDCSEVTRTEAREGRIRHFRETTRPDRIRIAREAERRFGRKVAWGAICGDERRIFTNLSVPVMTRLRLQDRRVLDTLVDAGVARSRSHALAWCVRLVSENEADWIERLRAALVEVQRARAEGPRSA